LGLNKGFNLQTSPSLPPDKHVKTVYVYTDSNRSFSFNGPCSTSGWLRRLGAFDRSMRRGGGRFRDQSDDYVVVSDAG